MGGHVASQAAAGGERCVAHQALVRLQARVGPDVSFENARGGKTPTALHALIGPLSCMRPGMIQKEKKKKGLLLIFMNQSNN